MPLPGGYDVELNGQSFILDESSDRPYVHETERRVTPGRVQSGRQVDTASEDAIIQETTDWAGGEGSRVWAPYRSSRYDFANYANTRIPGQWTGRPTRDAVSITCDDSTKRPYLALGQGILWIGGGQTLRYSTDQGATWTNGTAALALAGTYRISAMAGGTGGIYVGCKDNAGNVKIREVSYAAGVLTGADVLAAKAGNPFVGMGFLNGKLYGWTGRKLWEFDVVSAFPLVLDTSYRKVGDTTADIDYTNYGGTSPGSWWGDIAVSENSVFCYVGFEGQTSVYEYDGIAMVETWHVPFGLTGKSFKIQNGIAFLAGHWSGESDASGGYGSLYAMPLDSRTPMFIDWFRKTRGNNYQMQEMANSYGSQIMVAAAKQGLIFIYDTDYDAISILDDLGLTANEKIGDMITVGRKRVVVKYTPGAAGTTYTAYLYKDDEDRESVGSLTADLTEGEYDFGFPFDTKALLGFHVTFRPLLANQRISIYYQLDDAAEVLAATITSATTGASTGRVFITLAGSKFYRLRIRTLIDNNATTGRKLPIVFGTSPEVAMTNYVDVWELHLRLFDEVQRRGAPTARNKRAEELRDLLWTLAQTKAVVTFKDGARYSSKPNLFSTHTVYVDSVRDAVIRTGNNQDRSAEGVAIVRLKAVPT